MCSLTHLRLIDAFNYFSVFLDIRCSSQTLLNSFSAQSVPVVNFRVKPLLKRNVVFKSFQECDNKTFVT